MFMPSISVEGEPDSCRADPSLCQKYEENTSLAFDFSGHGCGLNFSLLPLMSIEVIACRCGFSRTYSSEGE